MTKPDIIEETTARSERNVLLLRMLIGTLGGAALVFLAGVFAGYLSVMIKHGAADLVDAVILGSVVGLFALLAYGMWRFWPSASGEPVAKSTRKATHILYAMGGVGVILGLAFAVGESDTSMSLFSNGPISSTTAIMAIIGWTLVAPVLTWLWWRTVDEHEAATYAEATVISAHIYMIGAPTWWIATRAGWLPAQDPMIVWLIVLTVLTIVWFYRRYF
jgi:hypothetical protein